MIVTNFSFSSSSAITSIMSLFTNHFTLLFLLVLSLVSPSSVFGFHHWNKPSSSSSSSSASTVDTLYPPLDYSSRHSRDAVKHFSCGKFYYRTFQIDHENNALFVGAMDKIFRINLNNINTTDCERDSIDLEPNNAKSCISKGKTEQYECRNHIRVIQRIEDGNRLYVCGTNAHSPRDWILHNNLTHLSADERYPGIGNGIAKCPFDPEDNSTAVWVEHGNPGDLPALYSGSVAEFTRADSVIFRSNLYNRTDHREVYPYKRTVKYDSKWLDKPHFVGSFDIGEYVYFFFRESAVEYINCGKNIFSRVARVCKKDIGGKNILSKNWASFLKARLNCSIPGEFPFYFNEIQHVTQHPSDANTFYAVFTTSSNGLIGSAVCSFTLEAIEKVFAGKFKEQATSSSQWLPVLSSKVPNPRPGACHHNTQLLPDSVLNFIRGHPLMDEAVKNDGNLNDQYYSQSGSSNAPYPYYSNENLYGNYESGFAADQSGSMNSNGQNSPTNSFPIFYRRDMLFTRLTMHWLEVDGVRYRLYYIGTACGRLLKLVQWRALGGGWRTQLLSTIDVFASSNEQDNANEKSSSINMAGSDSSRSVRAIEISAKHQSVYVGTDSFVKQIPMANCKQSYLTCMQCVRDPHCGWDQSAQECKPYTTGLLQDVANLTPQMCAQCARLINKPVTAGQSVHLPCPAGLDTQSEQSVQWYFLPSMTSNDQPQQRLLQDPFALNSINSGSVATQQRQRYVFTSDGGIVLLGVSGKENGVFECRINNRPLFKYNIMIDTKSCEITNEKDFRRVYADWCQELQKYKSEMQKWQLKQQKCVDNQK